GEFTLASGPFQGWRVSAQYANGQVTLVVRPSGQPWRVGGATLTVREGSELTYQQGSGVSGTVSAGVTLGSNTVDAQVTVANNRITSVTAQASIRIETIISVLSGNLQIGYADERFRIAGQDIRVNV